MHLAPLFGSEVGEFVVGKGEVGLLRVVLLNHLIFAEEVLFAFEEFVHAFVVLSKLADVLHKFEIVGSEGGGRAGCSEKCERKCGLLHQILSINYKFKLCKL